MSLTLLTINTQITYAFVIIVMTDRIKKGGIWLYPFPPSFSDFILCYSSSSFCSASCSAISLD